jgi:hypothetical protein
MTPVEVEPTTSAGGRPQTYALDRAATGTGENPHVLHENPLQMSRTGLKVRHSRCVRTIIQSI